MTAKPAEPELAQARTLVYVIGAQKAGTTWFHQQYSGHPDVHFARKEFHYWNARRSPYINFRAVPVQPLLGMLERLRGRWGDLAMRLGPRAGDGVLAWRMVLAAPEDHSHYRAALVRRMPPTASVVGDVTPNYAQMTARAFSEMASLHPDARFIFIMRDPVDRLWSGVRHRLRRWFNRPGVDPSLAARWFEAALEDEYDVDQVASCYDRTIRRLDRAGLEGRVLYLFYESLFNEAGLDRINKFLGLATWPMDHEVKAFETAKWPVSPSAAAIERATAIFRPTYDFVRDRFGAEVPERWRTPRALPVPQGCGVGG